MKRFFAKKDTWFDEGTEAFIYEDTTVRFGDGDSTALFSGIKDGHPDEEVCSLNEFDIKETVKC